jgi:hypothetical protein
MQGPVASRPRLSGRTRLRAFASRNWNSCCRLCNARLQCNQGPGDEEARA